MSQIQSKIEECHEKGKADAAGFFDTQKRIGWVFRKALERLFTERYLQAEFGRPAQTPQTTMEFELGDGEVLRVGLTLPDALKEALDVQESLYGVASGGVTSGGVVSGDSLIPLGAPSEWRVMM